jgi:iron(III) transport system ATP-binding protein
MLQVHVSNFKYHTNPAKTILENLKFNIDKGENLAVLGESGCGKSTLLHIIYGLVHLENGSIYWNGDKLLGPNHTLIPGEPFMKLVSQELELMPFTSVAENIAEHLNRQDSIRDDQRIDELLAVVELESYKQIKVSYLSGGQKQRVAIAKALANEPELLLLDEPFSSIDNFLKNKLRRKLFKYLKEKEITCVTATHDSEEALAFADNILLLKDGRKETYGSPQQLFDSFSTEYQGSFFGEISVPESELISERSETKFAYLLPHQLSVSLEKIGLEVKVQDSFYRGTHYLIVASYSDKPVYFNHVKPLVSGDTVYLKKANGAR